MNRARLLFVVALMTAQAVLLAVSAALHGPAMDDIAHLAAGISNWEFGRFDLYKVNPPLVRVIASLPVLAAGPKTDYDSYSLGVGMRAEFDVMEDFVHANGERVIWLVTLGRWGLIPLAMAGGYFCFRWARELYGGAAGIVALALWCFSPIVLAYAQILAADAGAAALGTGAAYFFWKWLRYPGWDRAIAAGIALGLAELTKTTWVFLFVLWPGLFLIWTWDQTRTGIPWRSLPLNLPGHPGRFVARAPHPCPVPSEKRVQNGSEAVPYSSRLAQLGVILGLGVFLINACYGFEGTGMQLRNFTFVSRPLTGAAKERGAHLGNRFAKGQFGNLPVPLPRNYVEGIDLQWHDVEMGMPSYLRGRWQQRGWWYWYLYALAVKVPLGTWGLFLLAVGVRFVAWRRRNEEAKRRDAEEAKGRHGDGAKSASPHPDPLPEGAPHPGPLPEGEGVAEGNRGQGTGNRITWRDELVLLAPAVAVLVLVSSQTGFSRYLRYVLPAFPFVFIWISSVVATWAWPRNPHPGPLPEGEGGRNGTESVPYRDPEGGRNAAEGVPYRSIAAFRAWCKRNWRGTVVCGLLAWSVGSSMWYAPHWMSYFNELAGGPVGGPKHLIDAQVDWGQDLLYLKKWYDTNPEARPLGLVYFGPIDPQLAGIEFELPPQAVNVSEDRAAVAEIPPELKPGWYAISVNFLYGYPHFSRDSKGNQIFLDRAYYSYFRRFEPVAMAGYSIYIYHLTADDLRTDRRPP